MQEILKLMEIAKDLTTATINMKNYERDDLKIIKSSDDVIALFKKMLAAVKEEIEN